MSSAIDVFREQREAADQVHTRLTEISTTLDRVRHQVERVAAVSIVKGSRKPTRQNSWNHNRQEDQNQWQQDIQDDQPLCFTLNVNQRNRLRIDVSASYCQGVRRPQRRRTTSVGVSCCSRVIDTPASSRSSWISSSRFCTVRVSSKP